MKSIVLELLRDGPPHNQLLSPLTKYMVLCGEHAGVSLQLGFEHAQWLARMASLSYRDSEETRSLQLADVASVMGGLAGQVPGLVAELTKCRPSAAASPAAAAHHRTQTVHLRLVLNANELALLPFELATAPPGFVASGQSLALQSEVPLCITREIRRSAAPEVEWSRVPRVLFAFAHPASDVPYEQHLLALRAALEPWVRTAEGATDDAQRAAVAQHLTVLPRASMRALTELCAQQAFTHIHILAHGVPYRHGDDRHFGLALHDAINPHVADIVDGERLAAALRPHVHDRSQSLAAPLVVSLASCDGANAGSVIGAGASIAHELHIKGIPLVIGSQFPLTIGGSIVMVDVLYRGLLWGQDPRCVIDDLRRRLKTMVPGSHDWASIVAYSALPADIGEQSDQLAFVQARESIWAALYSADSMIATLAPRTSTVQTSPTPDNRRMSEVRQRTEKIEFLLAPSFRKLDEASKRLEDLSTVATWRSSEISGLLAATSKRRAELYIGAAMQLTSREMLGAREQSQAYAHARAHLFQSRSHYEKTFALNRTESWALVQRLALDLVLDKRFVDPAPIQAPGDRWREQWLLARLLAEQDIPHSDNKRRLWAFGNLVELHLIACLWPDGMEVPVPTARRRVAAGAARSRAERVPPAEDHRAKAREAARRALETSTSQSLDVQSIRRQISRYEWLFPTLSPHLSALRPVAAELGGLLVGSV